VGDWDREGIVEDLSQTIVENLKRSEKVQHVSAKV